MPVVLSNTSDVSRMLILFDIRSTKGESNVTT